MAGYQNGETNAQINLTMLMHVPSEADSCGGQLSEQSEFRISIKTVDWGSCREELTSIACCRNELDSK